VEVWTDLHCEAAFVEIGRPNLFITVHYHALLSLPSMALLYVLFKQGILKHGNHVFSQFKMACFLGEEWICMECFGQGRLGCVGWELFGFYEGVIDFVVKDNVVVIQMVAGCVFNVDVRSFGGVQMCSFLVVM